MLPDLEMMGEGLEAPVAPVLEETPEQVLPESGLPGGAAGEDWEALLAKPTANRASTEGLHLSQALGQVVGARLLRDVHADEVLS
jgi:hypothetical protein